MTFSYRILNSMNAVMAEKDFTTQICTWKWNSSRFAESKSGYWLSESWFQKCCWGSRKYQWECAHYNVEPCQLFEFQLIHIFKYGKLKSSQKLRYIDYLSQGTKSVYTGSILTLTKKIELLVWDFLAARLTKAFSFGQTSSGRSVTAGILQKWVIYLDSS